MLIINFIIYILDKILDIIFIPISILMHGIDKVVSVTGSIFSGIFLLLFIIGMLIVAVVKLPGEILEGSLPNIIFMIIIIIMCICLLQS